MLTPREELNRLFVEELHLPPPPAGADLIATGLLDSLSILNLLVELEHRLGIQVPLETLDLEAIRTVEGLEALIAAAAEHPVPGFVVALAPGVGRPLFLIHDSFSGTAPLRRIAGAVATTRPIYGVQARGVLSPEVDETVEAMAIAYIQAIRQVEPDGPYALAGNSFGGLVAFEMACRLEAAGERVEQLIMIDTHAHSGSLSPGERLRFRLGSPGRYARHIRASPRERMPLYVRKLWARLRGEPPLKPAVSEQLLSSRLGELMRIADAAEVAYRPGRYPGDATLLLAETRGPSECSPARIWAGHVGGRLRVIGIPGDHADTINANLAVVGEHLSRALAE